MKKRGGGGWGRQLGCLLGWLGDSPSLKAPPLSYRAEQRGGGAGGPAPLPIHHTAPHKQWPPSASRRWTRGHHQDGK